MSCVLPVDPRRVFYVYRDCWPMFSCVRWCMFCVLTLIVCVIYCCVRLFVDPHWFWIDQAQFREFWTALAGELDAALAEQVVARRPEISQDEVSAGMFHPLCSFFDKPCFFFVRGSRAFFTTSLLFSTHRQPTHPLLVAGYSS